MKKINKERSDDLNGGKVNRRASAPCAPPPDCNETKNFRQAAKTGKVKKVDSGQFVAISITLQSSIHAPFQTI